MLAGRPSPENCPDFGYLLEADGAVVGALLLIFSTVSGALRCNVSSWYVEPAHRGHAALLAAMASKLKHVTYVNTSAAAHTWAIMEPLGYHRYSQGQFAALPWLSPARCGRATALGERAEHLALTDYELLKAHADAGCLVLVCETRAGLAPFVFVRRKIAAAPVAAVQLVYCRDTQSFVHCAGALGRFLLAQGAPLTICDAEGPISGLAGLFFKDRGPRFFKGPSRPRLNDLAFTEMVLFGP